MWAPSMVCWRGKSGSVVEWAFKDEEPEAEMTWVGVTAREKMSVM